MTLNEFYNKYKNGVDYDGMYGKQCVDFVNQYAKDVLGINGAFYGQGIQYAYQCYTRYNECPKIRDNFIRIANAPTNYPEPYDVIVWSKERNGTAGHIAVVTSATAHTITVIEQNYDGKGGVRKFTYPNYNNVLGWLKPRNLKLNKPKIKEGEKVTLKDRAKVYKFDRGDSPVLRICDISQFENSAECITKRGAKVKADKVIQKSNGNIWIYVKNYKGYICIYSYRDDKSKV